MRDGRGALVELLGLERVEQVIHRGQRQGLGLGAPFGGQVASTIQVTPRG